MASCSCCGRSLTDAQFLIIDNTIYKSCPECSKQVGEHVFYKCPEAFGTTPKRITQQNPMGLQSYCGPCRSNKTGPHNDCIKCSAIKEKNGYIINEIRFLPMSNSIFSTYETAKEFLLNTLPDRDCVYYFKTKKMNCPENTLVLFQYGGQLIGSAVYLETIPFEEPLEYDKDDFYNGYYQFAENTINVFKTPLTKDDILSIDPDFTRFGMAPLIKPVGFLPAIFNLVINRKGFTKANKAGYLPEEITFADSKKLIEGAKKQITVNAYERNTEARNACINHYRKKNNGSLKCEICGFDFGNVYGHEFKDKIHIHHLVEISTIGEEYEVDPINDLLPICPNCHMIVHSRKPAYTPDEIRVMLNKRN